MLIIQQQFIQNSKHIHTYYLINFFELKIIILF